MKKIVLIVFIIAGLFTGITLSRAFTNEQKENIRVSVTQATSVTPTDTPTAVPEKSVSRPVTFVIPKIGVNTPVESVAMDSKGNMDVPKDAANVAWYNLGPKPGETGSAVLAGHYDDPSGAPAVFYNLGSLQVGDELEVSDENGTKYIYSITGKESYPVDTFPISVVFGPSDKPILNLITCEGVFNTSAATYSHRLVVFSELKEVREI